MKVIYSFLFCAALIFSSTVFAQSPFPTIDSVDINNIKAAVLVHGDMWWNPATGYSACDFPKNSGKSIGFAGSLWMSGYDAGSDLHVAAQTYRQNGNDYWPGPLENAGSASYSASMPWAKIWKVSRSQIEAFKTLIANGTPVGPNNIAPAILTWPAKGNTFAAGNNGMPLSITTDMAPFVDVNNDGVYSPQSGDYPLIKGDQALWWVYNDNGPTHNESQGLPIQVEVHAMAYAYSRGTAIDNVVYYEYNIINKSLLSYTNFRVGQWMDDDLGYYNDDFIGFDSTHRMGITYNGSTTDGTGQSNAYGNMIPMVGLTLLSLPGDNGGAYAPAGSFAYYTNTASPTNGNPTNAAAYDNYLRSKLADGTHLKNSKTSNNCNYAFPDDPSDTAGWSECADGDLAGDRRFVLASSDFSFPSGAIQKFVTALLVTNPSLNNGCPNANFNAIRALADTVWAVYQNPLPALSVPTVQPVNILNIYPNPAHDKVTIDVPAGATIVMYNMLGQVINVPDVRNGNSSILNIEGLPAGIYNVRYSINGTGGTARFVKD